MKVKDDSIHGLDHCDSLLIYYDNDFLVNEYIILSMITNNVGYGNTIKEALIFFSDCFRNKTRSCLNYDAPLFNLTHKYLKRKYKKAIYLPKDTAKQIEKLIATGKGADIKLDKTKVYKMHTSVLGNTKELKELFKEAHYVNN